MKRIFIILVIALFLIGCNDNGNNNNGNNNNGNDNIPGMVTAKQAFDIVKPHAESWATDAKLVHVSATASDLEGKSINWKVMFFSSSKNQNFLTSVIAGNFNLVTNNRNMGTTEPIEGSWIDSKEVAGIANTAIGLSDIKQVNMFLEAKSKEDAAPGCEPCWHAWQKSKMVYIDADSGNLISTEDI